MAVTFRDASSATGLATTTLKATIPATVQTGDLLLLVCSGYWGGSNTWPTPTGWTKLGQANGSGGGLTAAVAVFWKVATSADAGTQVGPFAGMGANSSAVSVVAYSGVDTAAAPAFTQAANSGSTATTATAPTLTTTTNGDKIVCLFGAYVSTASQSVTVGAPLATRTTSATAANGATGAGDFDQATAGATGTHTATMPIASNWGAFTVALKPSAVIQTVAGSGSAAAQSDAAATGVQSIAGSATPAGTSGATVDGSFAKLAAAAAAGISSASAIASVGVDIVPAAGAGSGVSAGVADVQRAVAGTADAFAASSASADATSFAQPTGTNRANRGNGIRLSGSATVDVQPLLEDDPPNLTTVPIHIITPTVPAPTLVNGRPQ